MKKSLLVLALAAVPFAASAADGISYNYAQGGYVHLNGKDDLRAKGFGLEGSIAVAPNVHLFAGTQQLEEKDFDIGVDEWRIGAGYNTPIAANTDFVARVAYQRLSTDDLWLGAGVHVPGAKHDGVGIEAGVRSALTPQFEGWAMAGYEKFDDDRGYAGPKGAYGRLGGQFKFSPNWGAFGEVKFADGDSTWSIGPRITW
ncbi:Ax21 family protein [Luteimonas sp. e5]